MLQQQYFSHCILIPTIIWAAQTKVCDGLIFHNYGMQSKWPLSFWKTYLASSIFSASTMPLFIQTLGSPQKAIFIKVLWTT